VFKNSRGHKLEKVMTLLCTQCWYKPKDQKCQIIRDYCDHLLSIQYDSLEPLGCFGQTHVKLSVLVILVHQTFSPTKPTTQIQNLPSKIFSGQKNRRTDKNPKKTKVSGFIIGQTSS